jgi:hypothetical protein
VTVPRLPGRHRVTPRPFQRTSIDISHHGKAWSDVLPAYLSEGDIIQDLGRVEADPRPVDVGSDLPGYEVRTQSGSFRYRPGEKIRAFTAVRSV